MSEDTRLDRTTELPATREQNKLDARKRELAANTSPTAVEALESLLLDAVTCCQTILFSLPAGGPTIEKVKSDIPGLTVLTTVGESYSVSIPAGDALTKFTALYADLPDPRPEDLQALEADTESKLGNGVFLDPTQ